MPLLIHCGSLADAGLGKRLMLGSDQMIWPETIRMAVESIETAKKQYAEWFGRPGCLEGNNHNTLIFDILDKQ